MVLEIPNKGSSCKQYAPYLLNYQKFSFLNAKLGLSIYNVTWGKHLEIFKIFHARILIIIIKPTSPLV